MAEAPTERPERPDVGGGTPPAPRASVPLPLPPALAPLAPLIRWVSRLLPFVSLASGVIGAFVMDRGPKRAWLVALAAIAIWVVLLAMRFVPAAERPSLVGPRKWFLSALRLSLLLASQALMQLTLLFSLPFFFYAASLDLGHACFLFVLSGLSAASLWDPLTERVLRSDLLASAFAAFGSFAALTAVLPALGLSTHHSFVVAVAVGALGLPLLVGSSSPPPRRARATLMAAGIALLFCGFMYLGGARLVPAAPLRLVRAELGTELRGKWVDAAVTELDQVPERLYCATAIASPLGLRDRLFHVWKKGGKQLARVELSIVGGRKAGYRTHSRIRPSGEGKYTCTVQTASGQVLGSRSVKLTR